VFDFDFDAPSESLCVCFACVSFPTNPEFCFYRGGANELGATFWGQTELSCYDDSMHGIWGMSYKYHERAMVTNEKNLLRMWDIAYDGYNGGKDDVFVSWSDESGHRSYKTLKHDTANTSMPYSGELSKLGSFSAGF
jgi:hypothetical protein